MAFNIRVFGYRGLRQIPHINNTQFTSDTVYALEEPYLWSQVMSVNGDVLTPAFAPVANDKAQVIRVEVPPGAAVRFEVNTPGRAVVAGDLSPRLAGTDVFPWGVGFGLSFVDAAGHL